MKYLLTIGCLLVACAAQAVSIVSAQVETNGWVMQLVVSGPTNGVFDFGFSTNNTGRSKVMLGLTSLGYDDLGNVVPVLRENSGTKQLRLPYPQDGVNDVITNGTSGNVTIRLALKDQVWISDSNFTVSVAANWYAGNTAVTGLIVTNGSTVVDCKPFGNWSIPGYRQATNNYLQLNFSAWHWAAQQGRPVRFVDFVVMDQHSHAATNRQTQMDVNPLTDNDDYGALVDISTMTQGDRLKCDVVAYPWVGTNTLWTGDGVNPNPPNYCSQTNLCDRTGAYGSVCAIVDAVNGNNTTGRAAPLSSLGTNPAPFATVNVAAVAIKGTNSALYGHLDVGGGWIFLTNGTHSIASGGAYGTNALARLIITRHPATQKTNVFIGTGDGSIGYYAQISGVTITNNTSLIYWSSGGGAWLDDCLINSPAVGFNYSDGSPWYMTRCDVVSIAQGLGGYSTKNAPVPLVGGNTFRCAMGHVPAFCTIGNTFYQSGTISDGRVYESNAAPSIVFGNRWVKSHTTSGDVMLSVSNLFGSAVVQNLIEETNKSSGPLLTLWADAITATARQVLVWYNTLVGNRINFNYNETGTNAVNRLVFYQGNLVDDYNIKDDRFTGSGGANGARIGNWASVYGVNHQNNVSGEVTGIGASGLTGDFFGVNSGLPASATATIFHYVSQLAYSDAAIGTGGGDYRLQSDSLAQAFTGIWLIRRDMNGTPRGMSDPPGAYASGNPRKGFF